MENTHGNYALLEFIAEYYDTAYTQRNSTDIEFFVDYAKKSGGHTLELFDFKVTGLSGNFDQSPFTNDSPEMIFVTQKQ